jgi:YHS domain-containing protein
MRRVRWIAFLFLVVCVVTLTAVGACGQSSARSKALVSVDPQGVGAHGYDPVAFFTQRKATKEVPQWHRTYGGATYYFQSSADRDAFDGAPAKYAPQYGGYCAMAITMEKLEGVDPNYFLGHDDNLRFQRNEKAHMMFSKDPEGNHKKQARTSRSFNKRRAINHLVASFAGPAHLWGYQALASVAWRQNGATNT